jgi:Ca2+-binding RTX toxin-like protein
VSRKASIVSSAVAVLFLLLATSIAGAAPTKLKKGFTINLATSKDGTVNQVVVTYGLLPSQGEGFPPLWGHFISDSAGLLNLTSPEDACLTQGASQVFCPDSTSVEEPGAGEDFTVFLNDGRDSFTATHSIGAFEVRGGGDADVLRGSGMPTRTPGFGTPPETFYNGDTLYGDGGNDHIFGDLGPDQLYGGAGNDVIDGGRMATDDTVFPNGPDDSFHGGPGNDLILANDHDKDNWIDCGAGKHDRALVDRVDPKPKNCEKVKVG